MLLKLLLGRLTDQPALGINQEYRGEPRMPNFSTVSPVLSRRIGNGRGRPPQVVEMIGSSFLSSSAKFLAWAS